MKMSTAQHSWWVHVRVLSTVPPPKARLARVRALVSELEASLLFLPQQFTRFISEVSKTRNVVQISRERERKVHSHLHCPAQRLCELPLQVIISLHNEGLISLEELLR